MSIHKGKYVLGPFCLNCKKLGEISVNSSKYFQKKIVCLPNFSLFYRICKADVNERKLYQHVIDHVKTSAKRDINSDATTRR